MRTGLEDWTRSNACVLFLFYLTEVGKNINQDKTLDIQRYVEGYHELVNQMANNIETHQPEDLQFSAKKGEMPWQFFKLQKD